MTELWKKMTREEHKPKYKNSWYEISNQGRVRRWLCSRCKKKYTYIKGQLHQGYNRLRIKNRFYGIHRLVLIYFVGDPPEDKPLCDHKNRIRDDNRVENLHWVSSQENNRNRIYHNRTDIEEKDPKKRQNLLNKLLRQKKRFKCVCGGFNSTSFYYKKMHELTKQHKNYITSIEKTLLNSN